MYQHRGRRLVCAMVAAGAVLAAVPAVAQTPADNTKVNERDRSKNEPTADQQKENASDRDLTQKVRRSVMDDKTLSTYAHNVKVITQGGVVTLRGPVHSEAEKQAVANLATQVAGAANVRNELEISMDQKGK